MKVVKITAGETDFYVKFEELSKFKASMANIKKLEPLEMTEEEYSAVPISNQWDLFFEN